MIKDASNHTVAPAGRITTIDIIHDIIAMIGAMRRRRMTMAAICMWEHAFGQGCGLFVP